jgi:hypothetical protein
MFAFSPSELCIVSKSDGAKKPLVGNLFGANTKFIHFCLNAAMDAVDLSELAAQTVQQLTSLWDIEGVPSQEREQALAELTMKVRAVYTSTLGNAEKARDDLLAEIERVKTLINTIVQQLGGEGVANQNSNVKKAVDKSANPLRIRLQSLNEQLSLVELAKQEQITRIDAALTSLHALWSQVSVMAMTLVPRLKVSSHCCAIHWSES